MHESSVSSKHSSNASSISDLQNGWHFRLHKQFLNYHVMNVIYIIFCQIGSRTGIYIHLLYRKND